MAILKVLRGDSMSKKASNLFATEHQKALADEYTGNIFMQYQESGRYIDEDILSEIHDAFLAGAVIEQTEHAQLTEQEPTKDTEVL